MGQYGVIYIIRNKVRDKEEDLFKVGYSYDPERRCDDLTKETSNIGKFEKVALFPVSDMARAEKECHRELSRFRVHKGKEFFEGNQSEIVNIVKNVVLNYKPVDEFPDTHIPEEGAILIVACEEDYGKGVLDVFRCVRRTLNKTKS